ncbi:hypothetical protein Tco_1265606 [Tanacetum coccineum]
MFDEEIFNFPKDLIEDYHFIKDDIPLVSVYTTGNVLVRGMLIPDKFLTEEIRATDDYKEYEKVFVNVAAPMNQPQPVVSTQGTHRSTPRAHRTPTLTAASPQGKKRKQSARESSSPQKLLKITIRQKKNKEKCKMMIRNEMGSLENRPQKMQTPIPTTPRSPSINLSSDKNIVQELTELLTLSLPLHPSSTQGKTHFQESTVIFQVSLAGCAGVRDI